MGRWTNTQSVEMWIGGRGVNGHVADVRGTGTRDEDVSRLDVQVYKALSVHAANTLRLTRRDREYSNK
jgi:hypothetical protein